MKGSCHCGSIAFEVDGAPGPVLECNCSHCQRKGFLLWFVPRTQFRLANPSAPMATYFFNKHFIEHRFCPTCGTQPFAFAKDPKTGCPPPPSTCVASRTSTSRAFSAWLTMGAACERRQRCRRS